MSEFKNGTKTFEEEMEADRREMSRRWAELANKMGTLDEDLISPAAEPVLSKYFKCELIVKAIRVWKQVEQENFEVDVLVVCKDKVFMIEVKSTPKVEHVDQILEKAVQFERFFPEYSDKELIPIFASIVFPEDVINHATKKGLYVMAYREWEYMDIINFDDVKR